MDGIAERASVSEVRVSLEGEGEALERLTRKVSDRSEFVNQFSQLSTVLV